jgi:hypothetical protein
MFAEFDDLQVRSVRPEGSQNSHRQRGRQLERLPELIADVHCAATSPLRAKLLECLLQPIGPLGLVVIAAGAFGEFLRRGNYMQLAVSPEDATRISADQMSELARYVEQSNPDTFQRIASLLAEHPVAIAGLGGSVLLVALQAWRTSGPKHEL